MITTVLIAEDHTLVREGTRRVLDRCRDIRSLGKQQTGKRP
jgi:DNA-binding NarL/FixJ family response regulator